MYNKLELTALVYYNFIMCVYHPAVVQPVIASTAVGDPGNPLFMITTGYFSDELGGVGIFKMVVVRGSRVEPRDIPDNSLAPFGISPFV